MDQHYSELVSGHSVSGSSAILPFTEARSETMALPESPAVPAEPGFGPSHSHRVWLMMSALIDAVPEWAETKAFERDCEKMLRFGLSKGMTLEELYALSDPDTILGLWTEAEAKDVEV